MANDRVFRIQRPDGSFRGSGPTGRSSGYKIWHSPAHVKTHLKLASTHRDSPEEMARKAGADGDVVVEYELREIRRIPVTDFLTDGD